MFSGCEGGVCDSLILVGYFVFRRYDLPDEVREPRPSA
jgi:hypothetical protein